MNSCVKCATPMVQRKDGRWRCRPCDNAYQREQHRLRPEIMRERKRIDMAKRRADPALREAMNARMRENRHVYAPRQQVRLANLKSRRFFAWRVRILHAKDEPIQARDLARLWRNQRGICALTGARLDRTAQLDHILPLARGGETRLSNLQWVTAQANLAKRDLTNEEFLALCQSVAQWIGHRLMRVEELLH